MSKICTKIPGSGNDYVYLSRNATSAYHEAIKASSLFVFFLFAVTNVCYAQPINDDCTGAIELVVKTSRTYLEYSNQIASASSGDIPIPSCGSYSGADVWFKLQVPADGELRIDGATNINPNIAIAVYEYDCNDLKLYDCSATGNSVDNATVRLDIDDTSLGGDHLFVRVYRQGSTAGGGFKLSAYKNTFVAPENDDCVSAISLTNEKGRFEFQTFTTNGANKTYGITNAGCIGGGKKDVWFKAEIPTSGKLIVETNPGTITPEVEIYTGDCAGLTSYDCSSNGLTDDGGEVIINDESLSGDVVFIRVASSNSSTGTFDIVVLEPRQDECVDAILLDDASQLEEYVAYTNQYADILNNGMEPTCGNFMGKDIWFKIKVPANGELLIETKVDDASGIMPVLTAYTGTCENMWDYYACNFWGSNENPFGAKIQIDDDALAKEYIYIRMYAYNNSSGGVFRMATIQPSALPVELTSFRSDVINNEEVQLDWATATELNNDYFLIEHSVDGTDFIPVGRVDGKGTTSEQQSYLYTHDEPFFGVNYYRLKQIDFDGQFEYSQVVTATIKMEEAKINLFPNPVNLTKGINIRWIDDFGRENLQVNLTNSVGKLVYRQELDIKDKQQTYIDLSTLNLNAGVYHLTINDDNALITHQKIYLVKD